MARIIDVVEAPDQRRDQMVVRVPEVGSGDFRLGSAVNVRESQAAVFYRDGKAMDVFDAGRHHITTANLPLLSNLIQDCHSQSRQDSLSGNVPVRVRVMSLSGNNLQGVLSCRYRERAGCWLQTDHCSDRFFHGAVRRA